MPTCTTSQTNRACSGRAPKRAAASSAIVTSRARREPGAARRATRRPAPAPPSGQRARAADVRLGREHRERPRGNRRRPPARRPPACRALDLVDRRGRSEPVGERLFAGLGARRVEQLEERAGPEQIEIARVGMALEKSRAVAAASRPRAVEPLQAALVEPPRARARARSRWSTRAWTTTSTTNAKPAARSQAGDTSWRPKASHAMTRRGAGRSRAAGCEMRRCVRSPSRTTPRQRSIRRSYSRRGADRRRHGHRQDQVWLEQQLARERDVAVDGRLRARRSR